jgi:hypothetical protein
MVISGFSFGISGNIFRLPRAETSRPPGQQLASLSEGLLGFFDEYAILRHQWSGIRHSVAPSPNGWQRT